MDLLMLIVVLAVIGFALWLVVTYVPMPTPFKQGLVVLVVLLLVVWLVRLLLGGATVRVP